MATDDNRKTRPVLMTPQGVPSDGVESIDPRYFAQRAKLDRDDDESVAVAPRESAPMPEAVIDGDAGISPRYPTPLTRSSRPISDVSRTRVSS